MSLPVLKVSEKKISLIFCYFELKKAWIMQSHCPDLRGNEASLDGHEGDKVSYFVSLCVRLSAWQPIMISFACALISLSPHCVSNCQSACLLGDILPSSSLPVCSFGGLACMALWLFVCLSASVCVSVWFRTAHTL